MPKFGVKILDVDTSVGVSKMAEPVGNRVKTVHLEEMTCALFNLQHYLAKIPLLTKHSTRKWKAPQWSRDYLELHLGHTRPVVSHNDEGVFDYNQTSSTGVVKKKSMAFKDAMDLIFSDSGHKYYIQQQDIAKQFPQLLPHISVPNLLDQWKVVIFTNIWIGGKGCKTPLHFDSSDNFLIQMMGKKHVTLFPPSESENLYPAVGDLLPHCSRVNAFLPDLSAYPLYANAEKNKYELDLDVGDMLYIPLGWWHAVESIETSSSVNYWWRGLS